MNYKTGLSVIWLIFTASLVTWWWSFSITHLEPEWKNMFFYEGLFLLAVIIGGGASLILFSYRDEKRTEQLKVFLLTFSHDIKTSISRLRLKADLGETEGINEQLQRLELQLENALLLSTFEKSLYLKEKVFLSRLISDMRPLFPDLSFHMSQDCELIVDRRIFINALRNFLQNSVLHGEATSVWFTVGKSDNSQNVKVEISDNGKTFVGETENLGKGMLGSSTSTSGTGIGLYLSRILIKKINGSVDFSVSPTKQFLVQLELPGSLK